MKGKWQDGEFDGQGLVATGTRIAAGTWSRFVVVLRLSCDDLVLWLFCLVLSLIMSCVDLFLSRNFLCLVSLVLLSCLVQSLQTLSCTMEIVLKDVVSCRRLVFCRVFFCRAFVWSVLFFPGLTDDYPALFQAGFSSSCCTSLFSSCFANKSVTTTSTSVQIKNSRGANVYMK